jgi:hypothetical protein
MLTGHTYDNIYATAPCVQDEKISPDMADISLAFLGEIVTQNVMLVYICVSVVLIWQLYRTGREKLDITLDSTQCLSAELRKFSNIIVFQSLSESSGTIWNV